MYKLNYLRVVFTNLSITFPEHAERLGYPGPTTISGTNLRDAGLAERPRVKPVMTLLPAIL